jgi:hypothetical protein
LGATRGAQGGARTLHRAESDPSAAQIARALLAAAKRAATGPGGGQFATIRLHPEALGRVNLRIVVDQSAVSARFEASTPEAHALLERSVESLRSALEAKGLRVRQLEIEQALPGSHESRPAPDTTPRHAEWTESAEREQAHATFGEGREGESGSPEGGSGGGHDGAARERDSEHDGGTPIEPEAGGAHRGLQWTTSGLIDAIA